MNDLMTVRGLNAHYGTSHIVQDVGLSVAADETVALLGRNGVGKTTLVNTLMGLVTPTSGSVVVDGVEVAGRPVHMVARQGIALVPQGRRVWAPLTVDEHLQVVARKGGDWTVERVYELLPRLEERRNNRGRQLSGGEQQMLAIGRSLLSSPRLLLLDEPFEGLAPLIVDRVLEVLEELVRLGIAVLLVEQNLRVVTRLATRVLIMDRGRIVYSATKNEFRHQRDQVHALLGVV